MVEYKKEAFLLFENLLNKLKSDLVTILFNLKILEKEEKKEIPEEKKLKVEKLEKFINKK